MSKFPKKCVVDTNVPKVANLYVDFDQAPLELQSCILICVEVIEYITNNGGLVLDAGDEIFSEYCGQLSLSGQPGIGDHFMKWVHDNRWTLPEEDRVQITKDGDSYREFPEHEGLKSFDPADRKFVAVSNAHPEKPPILQATDCKWLDWNDALSEVGIEVKFLCEAYVQNNYNKKIKK
jgi:hypothetical protein